MNIYNFNIEYKKGEEMPSDYLSRNAVDSISFEGAEIIEEQDKDSLIGPIKRYLLNRELPTDLKIQQYVRHYALDCFIENDILWRRLGKEAIPPRVVLFLPQSLVLEVIKEAHGTLVSGHDGVLKTKERILKCYFWPGMDKNINDFITACSKCQMRKKGPLVGQALLNPLPQCTEPNQRVHVDLFGPLKTSSSGKKYILVMTDAFTKYVELVAVPDKEAKTVTSAILHKWICRFGLPMEIFSDMGGEFKNKLSEQLYEMLGTSHRTTSPRHPQCNAQVEIANKTIAKYLASFVDKSTLDWELYLAPLMLYYNTSHHRSIKTSPFFLTFGIEPRLPNFPEPELRRKFYGESDSDEMKLRLMLARKTALENNMEVTEKAKEYTDSKMKPVAYQPNQYVLLDEHNFLGKNTKLAPKYSGPFKIIRIKNNCNAELLLQNGKKVIVHFNRLKPYTFPFYETGPDKLNTDISERRVLHKQDKLNKSPPTEIERDFETGTHIPQLSQTDTPILFSEKLKENQNISLNILPTQIKRRGRPPKSQQPSIVTQPHPTQPRIPRTYTRVTTRPTPTKPPIEQGGIASRTRSRAPVTEATPVENFETFEQTEPGVARLRRLKRKRKLLSPKEIDQLLKKYKKFNPPSRTVTYFGPELTADIDSSSDSSTPVPSDSDPDLDSDPEPEEPENPQTDDDFNSAVSGSETETEDNFEDTIDEFPDGAAALPPTPLKRKRTSAGKFDKLIQKADDLLFRPYPKRDIPKKNYKE